MFSLKPKEDMFFDLFIKNAGTIYEASQMLNDFMKDFSNSEEKFMKVKQIELEGDKNNHYLLEQLYKTFITPFDREDIYVIAKKMDDIIDYIEATSSRIAVFNLTEAREYSLEMSELIVENCKEIVELMKEFKHMKTSTLLMDKIAYINKLEEKGDVLYRKAIKNLFSSGIPVLEVIEWREMYEHLEATLDACEDIANIVEGVVMKNA